MSDDKTGTADWVRCLAGNCTDFVEVECGALAADGPHSRQWWVGLFLDAIEAHVPEPSPDVEALAIEAKKVCWLEGKLAELQESEFHPDWSMLKASRDSVKECQAEIRRLQLRIDSARTILRWGAADPQKTVIAAYRELDAAPAGPGKEE